MSVLQVSEHVYMLDNQIKFAMLTGDYNPLHIDPIRARREIFGVIVVHGMHAVLRALQDYVNLRRLVEPKRLTKLKIRFTNAIFLEKKYILILVNESENSAELRLSGEYGNDLLEIQLHWDEQAPLKSRQSISKPRKQSAPVEFEFDKLVSQNYELRKKIDRELLKEMFPEVEMFLGTNVAAELATLSRLVGMHCPGMQSIFSGFDLVSSAEEVDTVNCKVDRIDDRFSLVVLNTQSDCYKGKVECFYRPTPVRQSTYAEFLRSTVQDSFQKQIAWIIGGSRGIGEATAKIVSAGGGLSIITYFQGKIEADNIVDEISINGGKAIAMPFDHSDPDAGTRFLKGLATTPNVIYYFASPKIFVDNGVKYDHKLFLRFADFYVRGLNGVYESFRRHNTNSKLILFNPSSFAIDNPVRGLSEYIAAKAASEALMTSIKRFDKYTDIVQARLPRIATDQTTTLLPYPAAKAEAVMYPLVQEITTALEDQQ